MHNIQILWKDYGETSISEVFVLLEYIMLVKSDLKEHKFINDETYKRVQ